MNIKRFRIHKRRHLIRRKPINVLASVMTTMNLYCGIASIFASIGAEFEKAAIFILVGIIFDALDGAVARITKSTSDFGKELDSLCDIVTFGVAPGVLVFTSYLPDSVTLHQVLTDNQESIIGRTGSYMAIVYIICAALRLARFNTFQAERSDYFTGLPSPAAGGILASFILFLGYFEGKLEMMNLGPLAYYLLGPMAVLTAFLMVSTVRYPKNKFKSFILAPRRAFLTIVLCAVLIVMIHYAVSKSPSLVLFPLGGAYVLFGIGDSLYHMIFRRGRAPQVEPEPLHAIDGDRPSYEDSEDSSVKKVDSR